MVDDWRFVHLVAGVDAGVRFGSDFLVFFRQLFDVARRSPHVVKQGRRGRTKCIERHALGDHWRKLDFEGRLGPSVKIRRLRYVEW